MSTFPPDGYKKPDWIETQVSGQIYWRPGHRAEFDQDGYYTSRQPNGFGTHITVNGIHPCDLRVMADHLEVTRKKHGEFPEDPSPSLLEDLAMALVNISASIDPAKLKEMTQLSDRGMKQIIDAIGRAEELISSL